MNTNINLKIPKIAANFPSTHDILRAKSLSWQLRR